MHNQTKPHVNSICEWACVHVCSSLWKFDCHMALKKCTHKHIAIPITYLKHSKHTSLHLGWTTTHDIANSGTACTEVSISKSGCNMALQNCKHKQMIALPLSQAISSTTIHISLNLETFFISHKLYQGNKIHLKMGHTTKECTN